MALSSVFIGLAIVITPVVTSESKVSRSSRVAAGAWSQTVVKTSTQLGLPFWRGLRQQLEAKKKDLTAGDAYGSTLLSADSRRDLMWHAVREVDEKFSLKYVCEISEGTTYARRAAFLQGQTAYTKASIGSARECALMCAADSFGASGHSDLACKNFVYNKTAGDCKLFNFAQHAQSTLVKDACCTTGPPCNLDSMREEIQRAFEVELKREMLSQRHLANQRKTVAGSVVTKQSTVAATSRVRAAETEVATQTKHATPKVEDKVVVQAVALAKYGAPKIVQKTVVQTKLADSKSKQKPAVQIKLAAPKIEQKAAAQTKHAAPKTVQKVPLQTERVASNTEQKSAAQAEPVKPLSDHLSPASGVATHHRSWAWQRSLGVWQRASARWRQSTIATRAGIVVVAAFAIALLFRGILTVTVRRALKQASA